MPVFHQCKLNLLRLRFEFTLCATVMLLAACEMRGQTAVAGQQTFSACAACHGLDGRGGEHAPDIATEQTVQRMQDDAILTIIRNGIPAAGMPAFNKLLDDRQIRDVLQYLRSLQGGGAAANLPGNADKGRELFFGSGQCGECHMVNGRGGFLGADLSGYGGGHSAAKIRAAIVAPDENQMPRRGTVSVVTQTGEKYRGIIRNEDNFSLQMQTPDARFHLFDKADLAKIDHESRSLMPADYGRKLSGSDLDDLIKFLSQRGDGTKGADEEEPQ